MSWLKKNNSKLFWLFLAVLFTYVNSLNNEFVSDDVFAIVNNPKLGDFGEVFKNPFYFLRPLEYWVVSNLFGKQPEYFRLINFVFHLLTVWGVYALVPLVSFAKVKKQTKLSFKSEDVGLVAALILAVHPLGAEVVNWISAGPYVQVAGLAIWSLVFFLLAIKGEEKYYVWSLVLMLLALFTMERAVVITGLMFMFVWLLGKLKEKWKYLIIPGLLSLVWLGVSVLGVGARTESLQVNYYNDTGSVDFLRQLPVSISEYLKLFVWPVELTLYHSDLLFNNWQFGLRAVVLLGLLGSIVWMFFKNRQIFFWLSWFLICLSPTLLPLGLSWVVAERYVYLAMIGLCVVVAMGFVSLKQKWGSDGAIFLLVLLVAGMMFRTVLRNNDWQTADNLYLSAERYSTLSPQNHNNLGDIYGRQRKLNLSRDHFLRAIELNPRYADAMHNLGNTYIQMGEIEKAKESFEQAIKNNPNLWQSERALKAIEEWERKNL
jgi:protein O-mannosyl-transferase